MYESFDTPPVSRAAYLWRLLNHFLVAVAIVLVSLFFGMWGYHSLEGLGWLDAFLNAAMLLGGEGPLGTPHYPGAKLFAGLYALYSGVLFIAVAGILLAPIGHRLMHRFHWADDSE